MCRLQQTKYDKALAKLIEMQAKQDAYFHTAKHRLKSLLCRIFGHKYIPRELYFKCPTIKIKQDCARCGAGIAHEFTALWSGGVGPPTYFSGPGMPTLSSVYYLEQLDPPKTTIIKKRVAKNTHTPPASFHKCESDLTKINA